MNHVTVYSHEGPIIKYCRGFYRMTVLMAESIKQNFVNWALGLLTVAFVSTFGFAWQMANRVTELEVQQTATYKITEEEDEAIQQIKEDISDIRVRLSQMDGFNRRIATADSKIDLHGEKKWHQEAGFEINGLKIKLQAIEKTVRDLWLEKEKGDRYTLQMAQGDQERVFTAIDKLSMSLQRQLDSAIESQGKAENIMLAQLESLQKSFHAVLAKLGHPGGRLIMNQE